MMQNYANNVIYEFILKCIIGCVRNITINVGEEYAKDVYLTR